MVIALRAAGCVRRHCTNECESPNVDRSSLLNFNWAGGLRPPVQGVAPGFRRKGKSEPSVVIVLRAPCEDMFATVSQDEVGLSWTDVNA